jgi:ribose/xylose/arabinose/galactoside ABC-type transport system permease subunit
MDMYRITRGSFYVTAGLIFNWVQNWFENSRSWFKIKAVAALKVGGCCLTGKRGAIYGRVVLHTRMQVGSIGVGVVRSHTRWCEAIATGIHALHNML